MRIAIGILGLFGVGVTVAIAQQPLSPTSGRTRAATLLPPAALEPGDLPPIARAVADDIPSYPNTAPPLQTPQVPNLWDNRVDPNVRPAGGIYASQTGGPAAAPAVPTGDDPSAFSRGIDKLKGAFNSNTQQNAPAGQGQPNASTPYRGTTANGAVVYAGPPTWRWYGWGSVTPGANPYAPTGQYQKASANWYSITGATPGAFPVQVTNPVRTSPGTEPPTYVASPSQYPRYNVPSYSTMQMPATPVAQPSTTGQSVVPSPTAVQPFVPQQPTITQAPITKTPTAELPAPVAPAIPNPSLVNLPTPPPAVSTPVVPTPSFPMLPALPIVPLPPVDGSPSSIPGSQSSSQPNGGFRPSNAVAQEAQAGNAMPVLPVLPVQSSDSSSPALEAKLNVIESSPIIVPTTSPGALPVSVMDKELSWQSKPESAGTWVSPGKPQSATPPASKPVVPGPTPTTTPAVPAPAPAREQSLGGDSGRPQYIARGQMPDSNTDPVISLVKRLCDGRAGELDVRWSANRRLSVCFECRGVAEAQKLVKDISARPEFVSYRIDFCVLVK